MRPASGTIGHSGSSLLSISATDCTAFATLRNTPPTANDTAEVILLHADHFGKRNPLGIAEPLRKKNVAKALGLPILDVAIRDIMR